MDVYKNVDILSLDDDMGFFGLDCLSNLEKYRESLMLLKNEMNGFDKEYDYILIDSLRTLGLV
ncbi:hypothetical protein [Metabacillus fastidiosus]|uniref:hypothetical protein n=1 Tax=Metabacillus fastidiosus TaxID=1458 RepID=UPI003D27E7E8